MAKLVFYPDARLRSKFSLMVWVFGLLSIAGTFLMSYLIAVEEYAGDPVVLGVLIALIGNGLWMVPTLLLIPAYCRSLVYEIHDDEVIVRVGIITKSVKHVPFRTVTNLKVSQGPFDRLFGLGTLDIQTAGMSSQSGSEESLMGLIDFEGVYDRVVQAIRRFRGSMAPTQAEEEHLAPVAADGQVLSHILEEVKAIRVNLTR